MFRAPALLLATLLFTATAASAATDFTPLGDPVELTTAQRCNDTRPDVAALPGGGFVAVWIGRANGGHGIVGRFLDEEGRPTRDALLLDDSASGFFAFDVRVVTGVDGGFVLAWVAQNTVAMTRTYLRGFDGGGEPTTDPVEVQGLALTIDGQGRPAVAWADSFGEIWVQRFEADLTPRGDAILAGDSGPIHGVGQVDLAVQPSGQLLAVWEETGPTNVGPPPFPFASVHARLIDADGTPRGEPVTVNQVPAQHLVSLEPTTAALAGGGFAVAWTDEGVEADVYAQVLDPAGLPVGTSQAIGDSHALRVSAALDLDLAAEADGGFSAAWRATFEDPPVPVPPLQGAILARRVGPDGSPTGNVGFLTELIFGGDREKELPAVAIAGSRLVALWRDVIVPGPIGIPIPCPDDPFIFARAFDLACSPGPTRLCLHDGRFAVQVRLPDAQPPHDPLAHATPLTDDAGTFWFFREANVELMVKVLDGRPVNGHFWVFAGAMSNVHYEIDVTDTLTAETRTYPNPQGRLASLADTEAFSDPPAPAPSSTEAETGPSSSVAGPIMPLPVPTHPIPSCDSAGVLCLHDGRFQAQISWHDPRSGSTGFGVAENLTDESGYFWFFRPDNAELVLKVLDGTTVNHHYWVFFGGLTDVEFTLSVEDVPNHTAWSYHNPPYTLTSHADVGALPATDPGSN